MNNLFAEATEDEVEKLWRKRYILMSLGFSDDEAFEMAMSGVKITEARELLQKGCSAELAAKILS